MGLKKSKKPVVVNKKLIRHIPGSASALLRAGGMP